MAYDFLEIQPHKDEEQIAFNKKLWELSKSFDIPLIMGTDTHSSTPYKAECRDIMLKQKGQSYGNEDHFDLSFKTGRISSFSEFIFCGKLILFIEARFFG